MTTASQNGKGAPLGAPNPILQTADQAADELHRRTRQVVSDFIFEQRVRAGVHSHEPFAGILKEHAASLDEVRDVLLEALARGGSTHVLRRAINLLREETRYVRSLAGEEEEHDAQ